MSMREDAELRARGCTADVLGEFCAVRGMLVVINGWGERSMMVMMVYMVVFFL